MIKSYLVVYTRVIFHDSNIWYYNMIVHKECAQPSHVVLYNFRTCPRGLLHEEVLQGAQGIDSSQA